MFRKIAGICPFPPMSHFFFNSQKALAHGSLLSLVFVSDPWISFGLMSTCHHLVLQLLLLAQI